MKKKAKMNLESLKVASFVTSLLDEKESELLKGGAFTTLPKCGYTILPCPDPESSQVVSACCTNGPHCA